MAKFNCEYVNKQQRAKPWALTPGFYSASSHIENISTSQYGRETGENDRFQIWDFEILMWGIATN